MKFMLAKRDGISCAGCQAYIERNQEMVQTFMHTAEYNKVFCYHVDCYIPWYTEMYRQKWANWKNGTGNTVRPHIGRPVTVTNPTKRQELIKLMANRTYHEKRGHAIKVDILNGKIDKLRE